MSFFPNTGLDITLHDTRDHDPVAMDKAFIPNLSVYLSMITISMDYVCGAMYRCNMYTYLIYNILIYYM